MKERNISYFVNYIHKACMHGDIASALDLLEGCRLEAPESFVAAQMHALHVAVIFNQLALTDFLLNYGVPVDCKDDYGGTALLKSCTSAIKEPDKTLMCLKLIDAGANIHVREVRSNQTLLHLVAAGHLGAVCDRLLSMGLDANVKCNDGDTPMHKAVVQSTPDLIVSLLRHGARVNEKNEAGQTPLFAACRIGSNSKTLLALVAAGARPDATTPIRGTYRYLTSLSPLQASVNLGDPWLIEHVIDSDQNEATLGERVAQACSDVEGTEPAGAHLARSLYAARLANQWVKEITANPGLQP